VQAFAVESGRVGLVFLGDGLALLLVLLHKLVKVFVTTICSDLQLVGVENFIQSLKVGDNWESAVVLDLALGTDEGAVGYVSMRAAVVLAVYAEGVELVFLDGGLQVDLLLVGLWTKREVRLH
jgi:hypothetical protein